MTWVFVFNRASVETRHLQDRCSRWLKNRPDFSKRGDRRLITGGSPSFYPQDAVESKSEPLPDKSRGLLLPTTKPDRPCFVCGSMEWWWRGPSPLGGSAEWLCCGCHPKPSHNGAAGETFGIIIGDGCPGGGEG